VAFRPQPRQQQQQGPPQQLQQQRHHASGFENVTSFVKEVSERVLADPPPQQAT
jgi:hypothetical protein